MNSIYGTVFLVGAGPGDPGLITVKGLQALRRADVVLYDRLIARELLDECKPGAGIISVGKHPQRTALSQARINALLVAHARAGRTVVRLKGGDPFVFGRGAEEAAACRDADIDCVVIPGVTSAVAVPAAAGVPVTHRRVSRSFVVVTGHTEDGAEAPPHDYSALARIDTVVLLMGRASLRATTRALIAAGRDPATPAACVASGATIRQRVVTGTLGTIADEAERAALAAPVVTVIGPTAAFAAEQANGRDVGHTQHLLAGHRSAVTQAAASSRELRRLLAEAGADVPACPPMRVAYPTVTPELDETIAMLFTFDWVVFTSAYGVRGLWRRLEAVGCDARDLGRSRVAAIGPGTARALRAYGVVADLVPPSHTPEGLLAALLAADSLAGRRVLLPHGSRASPTVADGLRDAGAVVAAHVVYRTTPVRGAPAPSRI
jgi:uroporphyrinogen III methyltransferase/synthase